MTARDPIRSTRDLSAQECDVINTLDERLRRLVAEHPKVLTESLDQDRRSPPAGMLTPVIVRQVIRQLVEHLYRAQALEEFVAQRLRVNHIAFEQWEDDLSRLRPGREHR